MPIITLIVIAVIAYWMFRTYNRLVKMQQRVRRAWADVDMLFKQRHELIPKLLNLVKRYANEEQDVLDDVTQAYDATMTARGSVQIAAAEEQLSIALRGIWALAAPYPSLGADISFRQLQCELASQEDKLLLAQRAYTYGAQEYNTTLVLVPGVWFASICGFTRQEF